MRLGKVWGWDVVTSAGDPKPLNRLGSLGARELRV